MPSLEEAVKIYSAKLVVRNNEDGDGDQGVNNVLRNLKNVSAVENCNNLKKDKEVKKVQLIAGLAFLRGHNLDDNMKKELDKFKVDILRQKVVETWEDMKPNNCDNCGIYYIYHPTEQIKHRCTMCFKAMCHDCCTSENLKSYEESHVRKLLHLICSPCLQQCNKRQNERACREETHKEKGELSNDTKSNETIELSEGEDTGEDMDLVQRTEKNKAKRAAQKARKMEEIETKKEKGICHFFRNNKCRHGMKGDGCSLYHPKHCNNFTTRGRDGCNEGKDCANFHPKLCYDSENKKECYREKCSYFHLPKTVRSAEKVPVKSVENNDKFPPPKYSH